MIRSLFGRDFDMRLLLLVFLFSLFGGSSGLMAQKCVSSGHSVAGGSEAGSIIGTDFDYNDNDTSLAQSGIYPDTPYRDMYSTYNTTLGGVKLIPSKEGNALANQYGVNYTTRPYNEKELNDGGVDNAYFITSQLEALYGKNPYSIVPKGQDGNSFYVYHNFSGTTQDFLRFYFPYMDYRGRDVELVVRLFYGNKGINLQTDDYNMVGGLYSCNSCTKGGGDPSYLLQKLTPDQSKNNSYGQFKELPDFGGAYTSQTYRHNGVSHGSVDFGVNSTFGAMTDVAIHYLGDENYDFTTAGSTVVQGVGNPAQLSASKASNNNFYGWYELRMNLNNVDYRGSGDLFSCFTMYFNGYNFSSKDFIAYDYINVKTAHICADVDKYCKNQAFTLTPFYYTSGHTLEWQEMKCKILDAKDKEVGTSQTLYHTPVNGMDYTTSTTSSAKVGDTIVIEPYKGIWNTFGQGNSDVSVSITASSSDYNNNYVLVYRAVDITARAEGKKAESFEVWIRPNPNCAVPDIPNYVESPVDIICANESPIFKAKYKDENGVIKDPDELVFFNWRVGYVRSDNGDTLWGGSSEMKTNVSDYQSSSQEGKPFTQKQIEDGFGHEGRYRSKVVRFQKTDPEGIYIVGYQPYQEFQYTCKEKPALCNSNDPTSKVIIVPTPIGPWVFDTIYKYNVPEVKLAMKNNAEAEICVNDTATRIELTVSETNNRDMLNGYVPYADISGVCPGSERGFYDYHLEYSVRPGSDMLKYFDFEFEKTSEDSKACTDQGKSKGTTVKLKNKGAFCTTTDNKFTLKDINITLMIPDRENGGYKEWYTGTIDQCKASANLDFTLKREELTLSCDMLKDKELKVDKECETSKLEKIEAVPIEGGCIANPNVNITLDYKDPGGTFGIFGHGERFISTTYAELATGAFKREFYLGTTTLKYVYTDHCGNKTETCEVKYNVKYDFDLHMNCKVEDKEVDLTVDNGSCTADLDSPLKVDPQTESCGKFGNLEPEFAGRTKVDLSNKAEQELVNWVQEATKAGTLDMSADATQKGFEIGTTYIIWKFTNPYSPDKPGYCLQKVEVNNKIVPTFDCPKNATPVSISTILDQCYVSIDSLLHQIDTLRMGVTNLKDPCNTLDGKPLDPVLKYYIDGTSKDGKTSFDRKEISKNDKATLIPPGSYQFITVAYKNAGNGTAIMDVYSDDCVIDIVVEDKQPPVVNCDVLPVKQIMVDENSKRSPYCGPGPMCPFPNVPLGYASASGKAGPAANNGEVFTLKDYLKDEKKKDTYINVEQMYKGASDNCDGNVTMWVEDQYIGDANGKGGETHNIGNEITKSDKKSFDDLQRALAEHQFKSGTHKLVFHFKDSNNNQSECSVDIIINQLPGFDSNCKDEPYKFAVDDNCVYLWKEDITNIAPTATIEFTPVVNNKDAWGNVTSTTNDNKQSVEAYPDEMIVVNDTTGAEVMKITNSNALQSDYCTVYSRTMSGLGWGPGWGPGFGQSDPVCEPDGKVLYTGKNFKTSDGDNFAVNGVTLNKGTYTITWIWKTQGASGKDTLGICQDKIIVEDTIKPVINGCEDVQNKINNPYTAVGPDACNLPFTSSGITKATLADLRPSDNCTPDGKFTLDWKRSDGATVFETDFPLDTTIITYIVTDMDGNSATCNVKVIVEDKSGPDFDCESLVDTLPVDAGENCTGDPLAVKALGLGDTAKMGAKDCSAPNGMPIYPTVFRQDPDGAEYKTSSSKPYDAPFSKGTTTIRYYYVDEKKNEKECYQHVIVTDNTSPFVYCEDLADKVQYFIDKGECEPAGKDVYDEILLQDKPRVTDNCTEVGDIQFDIYLLQNGKYKDENGNYYPLPTTYQVGKTYAIAWVFKDLDNNEMECRQMLEIVDTIPAEPINCKDKIEVDGNEDCIVTFDQLGLEIPKAQDECGGPNGNQSVEILPSYIRFNIFYDGRYNSSLLEYPADIDTINATKFYAGENSNTITFEFVDAFGNKSDCKTEVVVKDKSKPILNCDPSGILSKGVYAVSIDESSEDCTLDGGKFNEIVQAPTAYDKCEDLYNGSDMASISPYLIERFSYNNLIYPDKGADNPETGLGIKDDYQIGWHHLIYHFQDKAGNKDKCEIDVSVVDLSVPKFDCKDIKNPIVVNTGLECEITIGDIDLGTYYASKACDLDHIYYDPATDGNAEDPANAGLFKIKGELYFTTQRNDDYKVDLTGYKVKVGDVDTTYWIFTDKFGNSKYCPQYIKAFHSRDLDVDCSEAGFEGLAKENECYLPAEDVTINYPETKDPCTGTKIVGIPTRSDGLKMTDNYPTGKTTITWKFVSPYKDSTVADFKFDTCQSVVSIGGNNPFPDLECEKMFPPLLDTVHANCGGLDLNGKPIDKIVLRADSVPDPCIDGFMAVSEANWAYNRVKPLDSMMYRIDSVRIATGSGMFGKDSLKYNTTDNKWHYYWKNGAAVDIATEYQYNRLALGIDTVTWMFWDSTRTVSTFCNQKIHILTDMPLEGECPDFTADDWKYEADTEAEFATLGIKSITSGDSNTAFTVELDNTSCKASLHSVINFLNGKGNDIFVPKKYYKENPCVTDANGDKIKVYGVPYYHSKNIKVLDKDTALYNGVQYVIDFIYTDTTNTLVKNVDTCQVLIKVGSEAAEVIDCSKLGDKEKVLDDGTCEIKFAEFPIEIPKVQKPGTGASTGTAAEFADYRVDFYVNDGLSQSFPDSTTVKNYFMGNNSVSPAIPATPFRPGKYKLDWYFLLSMCPGEPDVEFHCEQNLWIRDNSEPDFDCDAIKPNPDSIVIVGGECKTDAESVASKVNKYTASEHCTQYPIPAVAMLAETDSNGEIIKESDGYPKVKPLPAEFYAGNTYYVAVVFANDSLTKKRKVCVDTIKVMSDNEPKFDCSDLSDTLKFTVTGECELPGSDIVNSANFPKPEAEDFCSGEKVEGKAYFRDANGDLVLLKDVEKVFVGDTTIVWIFKSPYSTKPKECVQPLNLRTTKELETPCKNNPAWVDTIKVDVKEGECDVISPFVNVDLPIAKNPCTNEEIPAIPVRSDGKRITDNFTIGVTQVTWIFEDKSNTLVVTKDTCIQYVQVGDVNEPPVDCKNMPNIDTTLKEGLCVMKWAEFKINVPEIKDLCADTVVYPSIVRTSGKTLNDPFVIGRDTVVWTYTLRGVDYVCNQEIALRNGAIRGFNCDQLTDTVKVDLMSGDSVYYDELKKATPPLLEPVIKDYCGTVKVEITRNDGLDYKKDGYYPTGENEPIKINFFVADTTETGDTVECTTVVVVNDAIVPQAICPQFDKDKFFQCLDDDALPPLITTYEEFKAQGGMFVSIVAKKRPDGTTYMDTVDMYSRMDNLDDYFYAEEAEEDLNSICEYITHRTYYAYDIRGNKISCEQTIRIKDTTPPIWGTEGKLVNLECTPDYFSFPIDVYAYDGCRDDVYTMVSENENGAINKFNGVYWTDNSNYEPDETKCEHYTYFRHREYTAFDQCGNKTAPLIFELNVVDSVAPEIHMPLGWENDSINAVYDPKEKKCLFYTPDIRSLVPNDSIKDNCYTSNGVPNGYEGGSNTAYKFTQIPEAGSVIYETQYVKLIIEDPCGNQDSIKKRVVVQTKNDIVSAKVSDTTICADAASLSDFKISSASGKIYVIDKFTGKYKLKNADFFYDYYYTPDITERSYEDIISQLPSASLYYSNNPYTDGSGKYLFYNAAERNRTMKLDRMAKSGTYYLIAMDTMSGCRDTSAGVIIIHESPRVTLDPGELKTCEDDSIHLYEDGDLVDRFNVCVHEMGEPITEEGWLLNGEKYEPYSILPYTDDAIKMSYYAVNSCGTGSSDNSLYRPCDGTLPTPATKQDSIDLVGSDKYQKWVTDSLFNDATIDVITLKRLKPDSLMLTTNPQDKPRVFRGESAELKLITSSEAGEYRWYRVVGAFDGRFGETFDKFGNVKDAYKDIIGEPDELLDFGDVDAMSKIQTLSELEDTASYYVMMLDNVCPAVLSNVVSINVVKEIPTAFTPHNSVGYNDVFMEGYKVIIFNRYGQKMAEGDNGWDGTVRGQLADPGVYFYELMLNNGVTHKGSIEIIYFK